MEEVNRNLFPANLNLIRCLCVLVLEKLRPFSWCPLNHGTVEIEQSRSVRFSGRLHRLGIGWPIALSPYPPIPSTNWSSLYLTYTLKVEK